MRLRRSDDMIGMQFKYYFIID